MAARKSGFIVGAVAGAGVAAAALAGVGLRMAPAHAADQPNLIRTASTTPIFAPPPGAPMSFADIFEQVSPAVVSIDVTSKADNRALRRIPGLPFDIFPQAPRGQPGEEGQDGEEGQRGPRAQSSGSGFFISADGYLVTNNHVVENAEEIKISLKDGRELEAEIIGRDEGTDLAVLKVKTPGSYPFVNFENSAKPRVGDWVITVGNPFGLGGTATAGIISSYGRDIGDTFVDYIQIDAAINRGNSGGPTFDVYGRVIGVNTAIFSPSGGSVGIGFAIPADVADSIAKQLISGGKVTRGYIGATIQNFTSEMADAQGLKGQKGAIVADLVPGGPSAKAGLQPGDVVVSINGSPVTSSSDLTRQVAKGRAGDVLRLEVYRNGAKRNIDIRSGVRPSEKELAASIGDDEGGPQATPDRPEAQRPIVLGMTIAPLDDAARKRHSVEASVKGVVIEAVRADSDAGEKGLRRGDVIAGAGDRQVSSASDLSAAVEAARKAGRPSVLLRVMRAGRPLYVPIDLD